MVSLSVTVSSEYKVTWGSTTHGGRIRQVNQDSYLATGNMFVVADGMGGHAAGKQASQCAVDVFSGLSSDQRFDLSRTRVLTALESAHQAIREIPYADGRPPGTTLSGVFLLPTLPVPTWLVANVGDSRTYMLESGSLRQLTIDHSFPPPELRVNPRLGGVKFSGKGITRNLGSVNNHAPDVWEHQVQADQRLLVCSDGLTNELGDERIERILELQPNAQLASDQLVSEALASGGRDNVTALVVDIKDNAVI